MLGVKLTREEMKEFLGMDTTTDETEGLPYDNDCEGKHDLCELLDPEFKRQGIYNKGTKEEEE